MRTRSVEARSSSPETNWATSTRVSGPVTTEATSTMSAVLRSRSASRISFAKTASVRCTLALPRAVAGQAHERLLEVLAAGRRADRFRRAARGDRAVRDDDDLVAERGHFLHHVAGEEHALAVLPQPPHRLP